MFPRASFPSFPRFSSLTSFLRSFLLSSTVIRVFCFEPTVVWPGARVYPGRDRGERSPRQGDGRQAQRRRGSGALGVCWCADTATLHRVWCWASCVPSFRVLPRSLTRACGFVRAGVASVLFFVILFPGARPLAPRCRVRRGMYVQARCYRRRISFLLVNGRHCLHKAPRLGEAKKGRPLAKVTGFMSSHSVGFTPSSPCRLPPLLRRRCRVVLATGARGDGQGAQAHVSLSNVHVLHVHAE